MTEVEARWTAISSASTTAGQDCDGSCALLSRPPLPPHFGPPKRSRSAKVACRCAPLEDESHGRRSRHRQSRHARAECSCPRPAALRPSTTLVMSADNVVAAVATAAAAAAAAADRAAAGGLQARVVPWAIRGCRHTSCRTTQGPAATAATAATVVTAAHRWRVAAWHTAGRTRCTGCWCRWGLVATRGSLWLHRTGMCAHARWAGHPAGRTCPAAQRHSQRRASVR